MHFYRRWQPVAAISFDLDDTLYDNGPAIVRAEQWMLSHLRSEYLATAMLDKPRWLELKRSVLNGAPELRHRPSAPPWSRGAWLTSRPAARRSRCLLRFWQSARRSR